MIAHKSVLGPQLSYTAVSAVTKNHRSVSTSEVDDETETNDDFCLRSTKEHVCDLAVYESTSAENDRSSLIQGASVAISDAVRQFHMQRKTGTSSLYAYTMLLFDAVQTRASHLLSSPSCWSSTNESSHLHLHLQWRQQERMRWMQALVLLEAVVASVCRATMCTVADIDTVCAAIGPYDMETTKCVNEYDVRIPLRRVVGSDTGTYNRRNEVSISPTTLAILHGLQHCDATDFDAGTTSSPVATDTVYPPLLSLPMKLAYAVHVAGKRDREQEVYKIAGVPLSHSAVYAAAVAVQVSQRSLQQYMQWGHQRCCLHGAGGGRGIGLSSEGGLFSLCARAVRVLAVNPDGSSNNSGALTLSTNMDTWMCRIDTTSTYSQTHLGGFTAGDLGDESATRGEFILQAVDAMKMSGVDVVLLRCKGDSDSDSGSAVIAMYQQICDECDVLMLCLPALPTTDIAPSMEQWVRSVKSGNACGAIGAHITTGELQLTAYCGKILNENTSCGDRNSIEGSVLLLVQYEPGTQDSCLSTLPTVVVACGAVAAVATALLDRFHRCLSRLQHTLSSGSDLMGDNTTSQHSALVVPGGGLVELLSSMVIGDLLALGKSSSSTDVGGLLVGVSCVSGASGVSDATHGRGIGSGPDTRTTLDRMGTLTILPDQLQLGRNCIYDDFDYVVDIGLIGAELQQLQHSVLRQYIEIVCHNNGLFTNCAGSGRRGGTSSVSSTGTMDHFQRCEQEIRRKLAEPVDLSKSDYKPFEAVLASSSTVAMPILLLQQLQRTSRGLILTSFPLPIPLDGRDDRDGDGIRLHGSIVPVLDVVAIKAAAVKRSVKCVRDVLSSLQ